MKKVFYFLLIFSLIITLNACSVEDIQSFFVDEDEKFACDNMEKLFNAIKNQDKEDIKDIFSQKAINEVENIDKEIDSLFSFVRGEVTSWEFDSLDWTSASVTNGQEKK